MKNKRIFLAAISLAILFSGCSTNRRNVDPEYSRIPSQDPPMGLSTDQVPMFVSIGFDDNSDTDGLKWIDEYTQTIKNRDGSPVTLSFFNTGKYTNLASEAWKTLYDNGHEIGNHSYTHPHGSKTDWNQNPATYEVLMDEAQWSKELIDTDEDLVNAGIALADIKGFRNPFLEYSDPALEAAYQRGFEYDCSIEEGYQEYMDGTNYFWPYTLDNGSPGNVTVSDWIPTRYPIGSYPGLWELPVYPLLIPSDDFAEEYNFPPGLQTKVNTAKPYIEGSGWKMTGFDYNLWYTDSGTEMLSPEEFLAILKYNLDLRLQGNKAPFMLGAHIDEYNTPERRQAIEDFLEYALTKESVQITSYDKILEWLKNPVAIN